MAAKPMPRLRAGISGTPILSSAKRSLPLHVKSKAESRSSTRHVAGSSNVSARKGTSLSVNLFDQVANEFGNFDTKPLSPPSTSTSEATSSQTTWEKVCLPSLEQLRGCLDDKASGSVDANQENEVSRLKQLMKLQISLISRQQDLLKLRDKEIMQLKQTTQSYKSRLERMERRIELSRRQSVNTSASLPKNVKTNEKSEKEIETKECLMTEIGSDADKKIPDDTSLHKPSTSANVTTPRSTLAKVQSSGSKDLNLPTTPVGKEHPTSVATSMEFTSPVSLVRSAYAASGCIPVPASYVDRMKNQLSSPAVGNTSSQPVVIKVCEHCSQCSSMVSEIKTEIAATDRDLGLGVIKLDAAGAATEFTGEKPPEETVLQSQHPYHLITWPKDDQLYYYTDFSDLDLTLDEGTVLNIPTWKTNKLTPLASSSAASQVKEVVDDETFSKRHTRLEVAEKRRKRWDIQRIREYRYNEKLRQKKLKQTQDDDFETFSPSLDDINAVQVEETLPVNVFGHLLQPLQLEEFSLDSNL